MRDQLVKIVTQYADGTEIKRKEKEVFANKKSVTRAEFYTAPASGLGLRAVFEVDTDDYESCVVTVEQESGLLKEYRPSHILWNNIEYIIVRDYAKAGSSQTEITVR